MKMLKPHMRSVKECFSTDCMTDIMFNRGRVRV